MVRPHSVVTYFLFDSIKIESETLYRYRYDYQDGHLRWARGSHAGTVDEGDLP